MTLSRSIKYVPIIFFTVYTMISLSLALFGPVIFVDFPSRRVIAYVGFIIICSCVGYHLGVRSREALFLRSAQVIQADPPIRLFKGALIISVIGLCAYFLGLLLTGELNTNIMVLGEAYASAYEDYQRNSGTYSIPFLVYSALAAPVYISSILGLFYFRRLSRTSKFLVVLVLLGNIVIFTLGSGKMKQLGDLVIYLIAIGAVTRGRVRKRFSPKTITTLTAIALAGVFMFAFVVSQRYSVMGVDLVNINTKTSWRMKYDTSHPVFAVFGHDMGFSLAVISSYISQGYYGLGLTLESAPTWSHFLGTSYSMSVIAERFFGLPPGYYISYPYLTGVETGWGESHWYTIFPWFASDFTFTGTGFLFGLFAFWYARSWIESLVRGDAFAVLLFGWITVGVFYVPANNQLMQTPGGLATTLVVVGLYVATSRRRRVLSSAPVRMHAVVGVAEVGAKESV